MYITNERKGVVCMIKAITKNPVVRNIAIGAMFAGAVAAGQAAKPVSNPQSERPLQEQLMSSDASKALAVVTLSQTSSTVKNNAINSKVLNSAPNAQERKERADYIEMIYSNYGTYFAVASLQSSLCDEYFEKAMDEFNKSEKPILRKRVESNPTQAEQKEYREMLIRTASIGDGYGIGDYFCESLDGSVYNLKYYYEKTWVPYRDSQINGIMATGGKTPSAKAVSDGLDKLEQSLPFFTAADHKRYKDEVAAYEANLGSTPLEQSNLLAFKVFLIDRMVIDRNIQDLEMLRGNKNLMNTLNRIYDGNIKPAKSAQSTTPKFGLG